MSKDDFKNFVEANAITTKAQKTIDWKKEKAAYLAHVAELYRRIEQFLSEFTQKGQISIKLDDITITEEYIGAYKASKMTIIIGQKKVTLTPIGTVLIAVKGRVDMEGIGGQTKIVLVDSRMRGLRDHIKVTVHVGGSPKAPPTTGSHDQGSIDWQWRLLTALPTSKYMELNETNFMNALMELSNG